MKEQLKECYKDMKSHTFGTSKCISEEALLPRASFKQGSSKFKTKETMRWCGYYEQCKRVNK